MSTMLAFLLLLFVLAAFSIVLMQSGLSTITALGETPASPRRGLDNLTWLDAGVFAREAIHAHQFPPDCRNRTMVRCRLTMCGFGCQIHQIASCVEHAVRVGRVALPPVTLLRYNVDGCSKWDCIFAPLSGCDDYTNSTTVPYRPEKGLHPVDVLMDDPRFAHPPGFEMDAAWVRGQVVSHIFRRPAPTEKLVSLCRASFPGAIDVGLHVRRGDKLKVEAQKFELREYVHDAEHMLFPGRSFHAHYNQRYNMSLFLSTDDPSVIDQLETGVDYTPYTRYHMPLDRVHAADNYRDAHHLIALLCELDVLRSARIFVGTFSSQISRLVFELKLGSLGFDGRSLVSSLDETYYL
jgi:hypothetical protein